MTGVPAEGRHEVLAGILTAATVLVVGYASGFGHLLGHLAPPAPFAVAAPQAPAVTVPAAEPPASDGADEPTASGLAAVTKGTPAAVGGSHHPAAAPATGSTRSAAGPAGSTSSCDPSLVSAVGTPFWVHLQKGHLEESPGQQVSDLLSTDQYVTTHTVLVEDLLSPTVTSATGSC